MPTAEAMSCTLAASYPFSRKIWEAAARISSQRSSLSMPRGRRASCPLRVCAGNVYTALRALATPARSVATMATLGPMSGQEAEPFDEPPREEIPGISRNHVAFMESTDEDQAWVLAGMHHVILRTVGRRSGTEHKVALPFWRDPDGNRVVVASFSGAPQHPSWYLNLSDRAANPEVLVRVQGGSFWSDAEVLDGD